MSILEIRPAEREGARLFIVVAGWTGSGKTVTALMLAYGLANFDAKKIGFIDTENRRGSLNADVLKMADPPTDNRFLIGDLVAPFSPSRYSDAIKEMEETGVEVCIIDSVSHEHEGIGGLMEIAGDNNKYWNRAKREHKKFMHTMLQSSMHIIACVRARETVKIVEVIRDGQKKTEYQNIGLQPICEKNFMFEATTSIMMKNEGREWDILKCPAPLRSVFQPHEGKPYVTSRDGKAIRDWVDGAKQLNPVVEKFRSRLLLNCEQGEAHIEKCWEQTPQPIRESLGEIFHTTLVQSGREYDHQRVTADAPDAETGGDTASAIRDAAKASAPIATFRAETLPPAGPPTAALSGTVLTPQKAAAETRPAAVSADPVQSQPSATVTALRPPATVQTHESHPALAATKPVSASPAQPASQQPKGGLAEPMF